MLSSLLNLAPQKRRQHILAASKAGDGRPFLLIRLSPMSVKMAEKASQPCSRRHRARSAHLGSDGCTCPGCLEPDMSHPAVRPGTPCGSPMKQISPRCAPSEERSRQCTFGQYRSPAATRDTARMITTKVWAVLKQHCWQRRALETFQGSAE